MEFIVIFWIGLAIACGVAANSRGRNGFGWFLLALLISPLFALLLLIAFPVREKVTMPRDELPIGQHIAVFVFIVIGLAVAGILFSAVTGT